MFPKQLYWKTMQVNGEPMFYNFSLILVVCKECTKLLPNVKIQYKRILKKKGVYFTRLLPPLRYVGQTTQTDEPMFEQMFNFPSSKEPEMDKLEFFVRFHSPNQELSQLKANLNPRVQIVRMEGNAAASKVTVLFDS
jgi:hypothetical protein